MTPESTPTAAHGPLSAFLKVHWIRAALLAFLYSLHRGLTEGWHRFRAFGIDIFQVTRIEDFLLMAFACPVAFVRRQPPERLHRRLARPGRREVSIPDPRSPVATQALPPAPGFGPRPQARCAFSARALCLYAFLALAGPLSGAGDAAHAQDVYVSNMGQKSVSPHLTYISGLRSLAMGFTTGGRAGGYPLGSVQLRMDDIQWNGMVKVTIESSIMEPRHQPFQPYDRPHRVVYELTSPASLRNGLNTFTAPAGATLGRLGKYFVVVRKKSGGNVRLVFTGTSREDAGAAAGWSIDNGSRGQWYLQRWLPRLTELKVAIRAPETSQSTSETPVNAAPVLANEIPEQFVTVGAEYRHALAPDTFTDLDGDALSYRATQADGTALPSWLSFDEETRTFSGTPQADDAGTVSVKVTASDGANATAEGTFDITVVNHANQQRSNIAPTAVDATVTTAEEDAFTFLASHFGFSDDTALDTAGHVRIVTLPAAGSLTVNGKAARLDQVVPKTLIDAGALVFTPAENGYGDAYATFDFRVSDGAAESAKAATMTVAVTGENDTAEGRPGISGTPEVGETVTAVTTGLSDPDGTANATYTYRWLLVQGDRETPIDGAEDATYTIDGDDKTHRLKVEASFIDDGGTREVVTSDPWPANGTVRGAPGGVIATFPDDEPGQRPASHDGARRFTVELHFSERPDELSYRTVGGNLLEATNAVVEDARRLQRGNNRYWRIKVRPTAPADIVLRLPVRQCAAPHGICADGRPLAAAVEVTIPYANPVQTPQQQSQEQTPPPVPLTADFVNVPSEHAGADTTFELTLEFSEAPHMSYMTVASLVQVTGGALDGTRRADPPSNLRYYLTIAPAGGAPVRIAADPTGLAPCGQSGQICTGDGRALQGAFATTVPGPVTIRVDDATVKEAAGAVLAFDVRLDRARHAPVSVDYETEDGTATADADYRAAGGTLTFLPGETHKTVPVEVLPDTHDDAGETLKLKLSGNNTGHLARATATGTIENTGPMPQAWLARFGRTASDHTLDAIGRRMDAARGSIRPESHLSLGGQRVDGLPERLGALFDTFLADDEGKDQAAACGPAHGEPPRCDRTNTARGGHGRGAQTGRDIDGARPFAGSLPGSADRVPMPGNLSPAGDLYPRHGFAPRQGLAPRQELAPRQGIGSGAAGFRPSAASGGSGNDPATALGAILPLGGLHTVWPGDARGLFAGTSFFYSPDREDSAEPSGHPNPFGDWAAWGDTALTRFGGAEGPLSLDGEVATATVGIDTRWNRWLAGVAVSYSKGTGSYGHPEAAGGAVASTLTHLAPFAQFRFNERASVWATLGYGTGELTLTPDAGEARYRTAIAAGLVAFGGRTELSASQARAGTFNLAVLSDVRLTGTSSEAASNLVGVTGETARARMLIEGRGLFDLGRAGALESTLEAGLRYDTGDAETGAGVEIGAGLGYEFGRVTVRLDARGLMAHDEVAYEEWGLSAQLQYRPRPDGRGLSLTIGSARGATGSGVHALWSQADAGGLSRGGATQAAQGYRAQVGYGVRARGGRALWEPYLGIDTGHGGYRALRMGVTFGAEHSQAALEVGQHVAAQVDAQHAIQLNGQVRF